VQKENRTYLLIKAMTATEKAYFKKYAFKIENTSSQDFKTLFNILDKQKNYQINDIKKNKKISKNFLKNINANLNQLNKRIVNSLLEYRKGKSDLSVFFNAIEEYELFKEKGLNDIADKKIKKIEQFIIEKDLYHFKPFLYNKITSRFRNNISIDTTYKKELEEKYKKSIEEHYNKSQVNIVACDFENLLIKNNSVVFKDSKNLKELDAIIQKMEILKENLKDDFGIFYSLSNNIMLATIMKGNSYDLIKIANELIDFYTENSKTVNDYNKSKTIPFFKNISYYTMSLGYNEIYLRIAPILDNEIEIIKDKNILQQLKEYILSLKALYFYLNKDIKPNKEDIDDIIDFIKNCNKSKAIYFELIVVLSILLTRMKEYSQSIDFTNIFYDSIFNQRANDNFTTLRIIRIINWLKLEEIDLFSSELISFYRSLIKHEHVSFVKEFINFINKFAKTNSEENKEKLLLNLISNLEKIKKSKNLFERMEANELTMILELAL